MHSHKIIILLFIAFLLYATFGTSSLYAEKGTPTLPGQTCQTEPRRYWTPQEQWVWTQICEGEIADFNNGNHYGGMLDPRKSEEWLKYRNRILTPEFLKMILLHEPFRGALTHHGVRIVGAWLEDPIDLSHATLAHPLLLESSRFDKDVNLSFLKTPFLISLNGSKFNGKLDMNAIEVKSHLFMSDGAEFNIVEFTSAKIGGQISMSGSNFNGLLIMTSMDIGNLYMRDNAVFSDVDLASTKVGGQIDMTGSKFQGKLNMNSIEVKSHLFMSNSQQFNAEFNEVNLVSANIEGGIDLTGNVNNSIDLTDASIHKEFRLASKYGIARWKKGSILILSNTKVGSLEDSIKSWPLNLELEGFTYDRLDKFITDKGNEDTAIRNIKWLKDWMEKQKNYSPQPYEHLAKLLHQSGRKKDAREILFASKLREHRNATNVLYWVWVGYLLIFFYCGYYIRYTMKWFLILGLVLLSIFAFTEIKHWFWLNTILIFIGYGYHIDWALYWALILVIAGMCILRFSKQYQKYNLDYWGFAYSIDTLLPIIHLRKKHYDEMEFDGRVRVYFYFHKILGYVLASFIITGLTGIVK